MVVIKLGEYDYVGVFKSREKAKQWLKENEYVGNYSLIVITEKEDYYFITL